MIEFAVPKTITLNGVALNQAVSLEIPRFPAHFFVKNRFFHLKKNRKKSSFQPQKKPGKVVENLEKISEKSMNISGEVQKVSQDQLARVRRRFRVVVSGPYWAAVKTMEYNLYSLGSPAFGLCLELGSGSRGFRLGRSHLAALR